MLTGNNALAFLIALTYLPTLLALLVMGLFVVLRGRRAALRQMYVACILALAVWILAVLLRLQTAGNTLIWLTYCLQYLGVCLFGLCLTLFGMTYLGAQEMSARIVLPLAIPSALVYLLIVTNPLHHWFIRQTDRYSVTPGPTFMPVLAINGIYVLIGLLLSCLALYRRMERHRMAAIGYIILILAPFLPYALKQYRVLLISLDLEPLLLSFSVICFGLAALRYHLLNITPLARRTILNEIGSALIICDMQDRIIDFNPALARLFAPSIEIRPFMPVSDLSVKLLRDPEQPLPQSQEIMLDTAGGTRLYELNIQAVLDRSERLVGKVCRLVDLDQEHQQRQLLAGQHEQLESANQSLQHYLSISSELRSIQVRNRLAREMHDSIGHKLIILMALLQRVECEEDTSEKVLKEAAELLRQVLQHLSLTSGQEQEDAPQPGWLARQIESLAKDLALTGTRLETTIRGGPDRIPQSHHSQLLQVCREALTNAVKHGQASTVNLFLQIEPTGYDLVILDDGEGAAKIEKDFGLKNMEERVRSLGESVRLQCDISGFGLYIHVPLQETCPVLK